MTTTAPTTDLDLQQAVSDELSWTPGIDARQIGVEVRDGVVTLSGVVASYPQKLLADRAVRRLSHVASVMDTITVVDSGPIVSDADLQRESQAALRRAVDVPNQVKAVAQRGIVTLSGQVEWQHEREAAGRSVRYLKGVTFIHNRIVVAPTARAVDLDAAISAALVRSAQLRGKQICVTTDRRGRVTLNGSVSSWADRDQAEHVCWAAPGVTEVDNQLHLTF